MSKNNKNSKSKVIFLYVLLILICVTGMVVTRSSQSLYWVTIFSFSAVISAALLISWGTEAGQFLISQGLAVAIIAILQVLPEFFVEAYIAWSQNVNLMLANFTGSNRLLMGAGWSLVFLIFIVSSRLKGEKNSAIELRDEYIVEILALFISSLYYVVVMWKRSITIFDSLVLLVIFFVYMWLLSRLPPEEEERKEDLISPPRMIVDVGSKKHQIYIIIALFLLGGFTFIVVAEPFVESMKHIAAILGISSFLFIQWLAPFLSEFPEKVTAFYWASRMRLASMALLNLISSKVNQWTILVAFIPTTYSLSRRCISSIPLDSMHLEEVFLTMTMTVYGCFCLAKFRFTYLNFFIMFGLFLIQFLFPGTRMEIAVAYLAGAFLELVLHYKDFRLKKAIVKTIALIQKR